MVKLFDSDEDAVAAEAWKLRYDGMRYVDIAARLGYADGYAAQAATVQYGAEHGLFSDEAVAGLSPALQGLIRRVRDAVGRRAA